jgi:hypothetical protein
MPGYRCVSGQGRPHFLLPLILAFSRPGRRNLKVY